MIDLKAEAILKLAFLVILIGILAYLVVKLMIMGETIDIMMANKSFI